MTTAATQAEVLAGLRRGHVPPYYWFIDARRQYGQAVWYPKLHAYYQERARHWREGSGMYLYGPSGSGKGVAAVTMLMFLLWEHKHVLWIEATEAAQAMRQRALMFDEETTVWRRMRSVDGLVIAHLGEERHMIESGDFASLLPGLLRWRRGHRRITVVTSYFKPAAIRRRYVESGLPGALLAACQPVRCVERKPRQVL